MYDNLYSCIFLYQWQSNISLDNERMGTLADMTLLYQMLRLNLPTLSPPKINMFILGGFDRQKY